MRYWRGKNLQAAQPLVSIVLAAYWGDNDVRRLNALRSELYSLQAQTYARLEILVVHDGEMPNTGEPALPQLSGVNYYATPERKNVFGHNCREFGIARAAGDYICIGNDDNYYMPTYVEWLLSALLAGNADIAYCDMVHSHKLWKPLTTLPKKGQVDIGCWMAKAALVKSTPWPSHVFNSDGTFFEAMVAKAKGPGGGGIVKVPATLFVHN